MFILVYKDLLGIKKEQRFSRTTALYGYETFSFIKKGVRLIGLEPTNLAAPRPKRGASTNFATGAYVISNIRKRRV